MQKRRVIDTHVHLYDHRANTYPFLEQTNAMFQALIGDYSALPRKYMLNDYLADGADVEVAGIVWHEFLSTDPMREIRWAQKLADDSPIPMAIVARADFLSPYLEKTLNAYAASKNVCGVREHLGWDKDRPLRRFASRGDLLTDPAWKRGVSLLSRYALTCQLEVFSTQLRDLLGVIRQNSEVGFTIAVMGWPDRTDSGGFASWKTDVTELARCENVRLSISALECIFGMNWSISEAQPWVEITFDLFGPERVMFGSHRPISLLATGRQSPYPAYEKMTENLSVAEREAVFHSNAASWFFESLDRPAR
jgi:predicted TIM-barrel fold metal-dependent hydrolase